LCYAKQKCRGMDAEARRNRAMDGEFRRFRRVKKTLGTIRTAS